MCLRFLIGSIATPKVMKILYVTHQKGVSSFCEHIKEKGIKSDLLLLPNVKPKYRFLSKKGFAWRETKALFKLLFSLCKMRNAKVYTVGGQYSCMLIFRMFGSLLGRDAHLFIHNFYIHGLGKNAKVKKILRFLMGSTKMTLIVQTPGEREYFEGISKKIDIKFVPYCMDYSPKLVPEEGYIFTGGYTNRDYELMAKLAERMPNENFVFVMSKLNGDVSFPKNVKVYKDIPGSEFQPLLEKSRVVVVPLKEDVGSSGQMLCLQAMRNAKPIVYCNVSSISYYFNETSGYPYELGNIESLYNAVSHALDGEIKDVGENALTESMKYTKEREQEMVDKVLGIV